MNKPKAMFYGFNPPFIGGSQKVMSRQEDEKLIKNDILQLLLTVPGERVMRPDFGVDLRNFVFENGDDDALEALRSRIAVQVEQNDRRVRVVRLDLEKNEQFNAIKIKLVVNLKNNPKGEILIETLLRGS